MAAIITITSDGQVISSKVEREEIIQLLRITGVVQQQLLQLLQTETGGATEERQDAKDA